jgi:endonuclease/exonuclease/phosphatase family metal-dependent hydrolase
LPVVRVQLESGTLTVCSVHLHPPAMLKNRDVVYLEYMAPLKEALLRIADGGPVLLAGDFNVAPKDFAALVKADQFWNK